MTEFKHLFEQMEVAKMKLGNRVLMPAMHLGMAKEGFVTDAFIDFYEERAKADPGPALIIVGGCYPEKRGMGAPNFVALDDDKYVPRLSEFTDRMHRHGTLVAAQLYHSGRYSFSFVIGEQPVSASSVPSRFTGETPRALTVEEIKETQENFARAAGRAKEAGFDASELICAAGYLVNQFLSPLTNKREDEYGGDIYGRMTFLVETIEAIKRETGEDYPLICRISGSDFMEGGHTLEETKVVAAAMEECGVDLINVTGGWHETRVPQITMNVPRGAYVYLAEGVKESIRDVPVVACNRINDPLLAEQVLAQGRADLVGMARAFIADPRILEKAAQGRTEDIRICIACNQGCFDNIFVLKPVSCLMNPRVHRERETEPNPADVKKKVLVAGGGPGGMEAAWVSAHRGHEVILCEESDRLGGQGLLAAIPPGRKEWSEMVRYLSRQQHKHGVDVRLGTRVDRSLVEDIGPDVLVLATGARQRVPPIEGIEGENVVMAWDVLREKAGTGERVVIVGGGATGIETGAFLAERGKEVVVLEMLEKLGSDIGISSRWVILQDARSLGVEMLSDFRVNLIKDSGVEAESNGQIREFPCDTVVIAVGSESRVDLEEELRAEGLPEGLEMYRTGDCIEPRKAYEAIHEGFEIGLRI